MESSCLPAALSSLKIAGERDRPDPDVPSTANADEAVSSPTQASVLDPYAKYLSLFSRSKEVDAHNVGDTFSDLHKMKIAPLFSSQVHEKALSTFTFSTAQQQPYPQFGLLGMSMSAEAGSTPSRFRPEDRLVFSNTAEPWSTFICGSQGSGKSHTLSCLLENNLLPSNQIGSLSKPLTGMIFHYDKFSNFNCGQICEAAYLCSAGVPVKILVAPTSFSKMQKQYHNLPGLPPGSRSPTVLPLYFSQEQLSIDVMMTLMAVHDTGEAAPLYISAIRQLLREIAMDNQDKQGFDYDNFRQQLGLLSLTEAQCAPLDLRLQLLESVLLETQQTARSRADYDKIWDFRPGTLTIVDLSDQFVNTSDACALFSICLKLFMGGWQANPRIVALDEAHKFLTNTTESTKLTTDLISIIRQQRHLSSRVVIATQEPTVSGELLDLCNVSIIHRFNSPEWYRTIKNHLAGAHADANDKDKLFTEIVKLSTGEALVFCPTAVLKMESSRPQTLQDRYVKLLVRDRVTADGGQSIRSSHAAPTKTVAPKVIAPTFARFKGGNLPAPGSLARQQHKGKPTMFNGPAPSSAVALAAPASNTRATRSNILPNVNTPTRSSSTSSAGQKRQRTGYDGAADMDSGDHEEEEDEQETADEDLQTITSPIAITYGNDQWHEEYLEGLIYHVIKHTLRDFLPYDPSGYMGEMLKQVENKLGVPEMWLAGRPLGHGCRDEDAKQMMKRTLKRYYDHRGVAKAKRANVKWLQD